MNPTTATERAVLQTGDEEKICEWYHRVGSMLDSHADLPTAELLAYREVFPNRPVELVKI